MVLRKVRSLDNVPGPHPHGREAAPQECDGQNDIPGCNLGIAGGAALKPDTPEVLPRTTDDPALAVETNGLGGSNPTTIQTSDIITSTIYPSQSVDPTLSTTVVSSEPSLVTAGSVEGPAHDNSGLTTGEVVGIAVGTLFIGAGLAFIAAFFLFKRRKRQQNGNIGERGYQGYGDSVPEFTMVQKSVGSLGDMHSPYVQVPQTPMLARRPIPPAIPAPVNMDHTTHTDMAGFLPPVARDSEVCDRVSALFEKMHEHVERNYRDIHASITPSMESGIASFGAKGVNMTEMLQECSNPTTALKHALVSYVMAITSSKKDEEHTGTLFPEELGSIKSERHSSSSDPGVAAAASLLKRTSVYLYTSTSGTPESAQSWAIQSSAREAAEHFSMTFFPWANPTCSDQQKDEDLTSIIIEAREISIWLFGQPYVYEFEWGGAGRRGVLVSPGLVRRTHATGDDEQETRVVEGAVVGM
ncbi:hypothetical protein COCC4DRAFT_29483 [Bipolaris maydis ATCC 48331]|uniref:Uncharacterized protein n=2 Tax=Cochliobolus heterostrophus TaxID=5016 RepID=M2V7M2_COCH5|nr:uncharacterized protein COCC4DRAFT_29483 [Bipolaris maydis ATCC 48331]EMD96012.1 hypothetical protein COCHEDRAFT_1127381 [Bipolaris maydis C5]KAJ5030714.1 hypothetical protein J3E73DRAFT_26207 [Bipolaris maydis]ENI10870.1 hypothetical protein COCC4DRAFT_29483 [Bipolaris maydis ATCC 48331]KAJ5065731.1 hypothetical protein J3E74DRAFT_260896 [Bipolaris maydis]KAJ6200935.1 hypothetical protein J3E72DRAFT_236767 [Bipolaris maydis]